MEIGLQQRCGSPRDRSCENSAGRQGVDAAAVTAILDATVMLLFLVFAGTVGCVVVAEAEQSSCDEECRAVTRMPALLPAGCKPKEVQKEEYTLIRNRQMQIVRVLENGWVNEEKFSLPAIKR